MLRWGFFHLGQPRWAASSKCSKWSDKMLSSHMSRYPTLGSGQQPQFPLRNLQQVLKAGHWCCLSGHTTESEYEPRPSALSSAAGTFVRKGMCWRHLPCSSHWVPSGQQWTWSLQQVACRMKARNEASSWDITASESTSPVKEVATGVGKLSWACPCCQANVLPKQPHWHWVLRNLWHQNHCFGDMVGL